MRPPSTPGEGVRPRARACAIQTQERQKHDLLRERGSEPVPEQSGTIGHGQMLPLLKFVPDLLDSKRSLREDLTLVKSSPEV